MRILFIIAIVLTLLSNNSVAFNDYSLKFKPGNNNYLLILNKLIIKSRLLDLDEKEKGNVNYLESFYLDILDEKTKEFNENELKIKEIIRTKGINHKDARKIVRKNAELYLQLGYTFIESLEYIKTNLGISNFNKLMYSNEIDLFDLNEFKSDTTLTDEIEFDADLESTGIEEEGDIQKNKE